MTTKDFVCQKNLFMFVPKPSRLRSGLGVENFYAYRGGEIWGLGNCFENFSMLKIYYCFMFDLMKIWNLLMKIWEPDV